jgi:hypothetical protein
MKIAARVFYEVLKTYSKATAIDVRDFMVGKDFQAMKVAIKTEISTTTEGAATVFIRTTAGKAKVIMRQVVAADEIETVIDEWADNKAYEKLINDCLEFIYDGLVTV